MRDPILNDGPCRRPRPLRGWRSALAVTGLILALGPAGCETGEKTRAAARPGRLDAGALKPSGTLDPSDPARFREEATEDDWEALVNTDLDDLRELRQRARERAAMAAAPGAAPRTGPPRIDWTKPAGQRTTGGSAAGATGAAGSAVAAGRSATALARDAAPPITVRPLAAGPPPAVRPADASRSVNAPAVGLTDDQLSLLLVDLRRELNLRKAYSNQPLRELLTIAAQGIVDPDLDINPDAFNGLTETERELLQKLQKFFADLGRQLDGSLEAETVIIGAVAELKQVLDRQPELELPAAKLCWRVGGFGDFDAFSRDSFLAHTEQQVILYLEIDRFTSEQNQKSQWVTEISQQLEIYSDSDGIPVWSETWQKAVDMTNNRRRDFFTTQIITLPIALSVGRYHLKIRARDEKSGAEAETSIPFEMVADPKLAATVGK